jgi:hypothetical protein
MKKSEITKVRDYQDFTDINTSTEQRKKWYIGDIWANQVKCLKCGEMIRSKNRHDCVTCSCGAISVDGGSWYLKRSGDWNNYEELSIMYNDIGDKKEIG